MFSALFNHEHNAEKTVQLPAFVHSLYSVECNLNFALRVTRGVHTVQANAFGIDTLNSLACRRCTQAGSRL